MRLSLIAILAILFSACGNMKQIEFLGEEKFEFKGMNGRELTFNVGGKVMNPNWYAVKIKPSDVEVYLDGTLFGVVHLDNKVKAKRKQETELNVPLRLTTEDGALFHVLRLSRKDSVELRLLGDVKGGVLFLSKKKKVDEVRKIATRNLRLNQFKM